MQPSEPCPACLHEATTHAGNKDGYDLWRCTGCETVRVSPLPSPHQLDAFYQAYTGTCDYTKKRARKIQRSRRRIKRLMRKHAGKDFLDVGCNYGFAVAAAAELGLQAQGIDIDATAVAASAEQFGNIARFDCRTVQDHAASGAKADILYTSEVIEHTLDPNSFASAMATILKPGGLLYLTTPDGAHFTKPKDFTKWAQVIPPEHLVYFSRRGMKAMLQRHGFRDVKFAFNHKPGMRVTARRTA